MAFVGRSAAVAVSTLALAMIGAALVGEMGPASFAQELPRSGATGQTAGVTHSVGIVSALEFPKDTRAQTNLVRRSQLILTATVRWLGERQLPESAFLRTGQTVLFARDRLLKGQCQRIVPVVFWLQDSPLVQDNALSSSIFYPGSRMTFLLFLTEERLPRSAFRHAARGEMSMNTEYDECQLALFVGWTQADEIFLVRYRQAYELGAYRVTDEALRATERLVALGR